MLCLQAMPNEPVICVTEFDENGFENRRVEIWRSGRVGYAGENGSSNDTGLGSYQFMGMDQFDDEPYLAVEITRAEFENHWNLALKARDE